MGLGPDQLEALTECVELINTARRSAGMPPAGMPLAGVVPAGVVPAGPASAGPASAGPASAGPASAGPASAGPASADQLADLAGVAAFARRHRVENRSAAHASDVPRLRELRARLDAIVAACEAGAVQKAIRDLNALLAETGAVPRIVTHDGRPPHIHVSRATAPLADRIAAHSAMGLAELIVAGESGRVRSCASPRCDQVFIDLSRNQSRRYCDSRTCGNRIHVAAYRSRQSAISLSPLEDPVST